MVVRRTESQGEVMTLAYSSAAVSEAVEREFCDDTPVTSYETPAMPRINEEGGDDENDNSSDVSDSDSSDSEDGEIDVSTVKKKDETLAQTLLRKEEELQGKMDGMTELLQEQGLKKKLAKRAAKKEAKKAAKREEKKQLKKLLDSMKDVICMEELEAFDGPPVFEEPKTEVAYGAALPPPKFNLRNPNDGPLRTLHLDIYRPLSSTAYHGQMMSQLAAFVAGSSTPRVIKGIKGDAKAVVNKTDSSDPCHKFVGRTFAETGLRHQRSDLTVVKTAKTLGKDKSAAFIAQTKKNPEEEAGFKRSVTGLRLVPGMSALSLGDGMSEVGTPSNMGGDMAANTLLNMDATTVSTMTPGTLTPVSPSSLSLARSVSSRSVSSRSTKSSSSSGSLCPTPTVSAQKCFQRMETMEKKAADIKLQRVWAKHCEDINGAQEQYGDGAEKDLVLVVPKTGGVQLMFYGY